jgi:predicted PurR-regulated permease PerM
MGETLSIPPWLRYLVRTVLYLLLGVLLIYLVWRVRLVLIVLLLGLLLAYALRPLVSLFERLQFGGWRFPRGLAVACASLLVLAFIWVLIVSLLPPMGGEIADLKANFPKQRQALSEALSSVREFYERNLPASVVEAIDEYAVQMRHRSVALISALLSSTFRGIGFIAELFLVPILAFYFLADAERLRQQILFFVPERSRRVFSRSLAGFHDIMYRYVIGQLILCVVAFVVVSIALWALKIKFWLLLGILAGITRAVPIIGPLLGGIPVVAACLAQSQSFAFGFWVTVGFILLHLFESKYLMPAILGRQLGLHPVLIIFALLVGAEFFGLVGMFIAVPVLAAIQFLIADYRAHAQASAEQVS